MAALMLYYHSIAPCIYKGDISTSAICHLQRFVCSFNIVLSPRHTTATTCSQQLISSCSIIPRHYFRVAEQCWLHPELMAVSQHYGRNSRLPVSVQLLQRGDAARAASSFFFLPTLITGVAHMILLMCGRFGLLQLMSSMLLRARSCCSVAQPLVETVVLHTILWDIRAWSERFLVLFALLHRVYSQYMFRS